ncbi:hypothetical protein [Parabacteroides sp. PF5-6]|uniref:hypothetical protein n=1 Tax=Parabacteroides sp. PF5-6 TaxID=1742403 RepID=UPI00240504D7|nr:hypothetical protein [Parabacteroides sp. PF5-6]MDF9830162.1 hypothetical protein [Parabacteroides sp. PF5-6]
MNLFDLLANFWRVDEQKNFSGNETRLYFYLIHLANRSYWSEWIEYSNDRMVANANISLQVLKSARDRLKEAGLLDYVSGGGHRVKTKYRILAPKSDSKLPPYNKTKDKKSNTNSYGKKKGFIHSGSDFD